MPENKSVPEHMLEIFPEKSMDWKAQIVGVPRLLRDFGTFHGHSLGPRALSRSLLQGAALCCLHHIIFSENKSWIKQVIRVRS